MNKSLFKNLSLSESDDFTYLIPLMSTDDEKRLNSLGFLKGLFAFEKYCVICVVIPITVSKGKSIKLINNAYRFKKPIGVIAQSNQKLRNLKLKTCCRNSCENLKII